MRIWPIVILLFGLGASAAAAPARHWQPAETAENPARTRAIDALLADYASHQRPTALAVVQDGRMLGSWGDIARPVTVNSIRKSLLGALFGIAVDEGRIRLDDTLAGLGIDDQPPALTATEKSATVRDLLSARSGIYHPAAFETGEMRRTRPERGAHAPGSFWFYNNWDFNALGTIYRRATGEEIFESFARRIATPLQMEDFGPRSGRYVRSPASEHPAYVFDMSARDMARFGLLVLDHGSWNGKRVVPADWLAASTRPISETGRGSRRYGYLWWVLPPREAGGDAAFLASGFGGQFIAVVPAKRLVVTQTVAKQDNPRGVRSRAFLELVRAILSAA